MWGNIWHEHTTIPATKRAPDPPVPQQHPMHSLSAHSDEQVQLWGELELAFLGVALRKH
jgi:hypothetical protein